MNISVIIPIYNVEKYVERCILSIMNQTYTESDGMYCGERLHSMITA